MFCKREMFKEQFIPLCGKIQECIKGVCPSCFILLVSALILSCVVPFTSGFQEKNIISSCLSTAGSSSSRFASCQSGRTRKTCP